MTGAFECLFVLSLLLLVLHSRGLGLLLLGPLVLLLRCRVFTIIVDGSLLSRHLCRDSRGRLFKA